MQRIVATRPAPSGEISAHLLSMPTEQSSRVLLRHLDQVFRDEATRKPGSLPVLPSPSLSLSWMPFRFFLASRPASSSSRRDFFFSSFLLNFAILLHGLGLGFANQNSPKALTWLLRLLRLFSWSKAKFGSSRQS